MTEQALAITRTDNAAKFDALEKARVQLQQHVEELQQDKTQLLREQLQQKMVVGATSARLALQRHMCERIAHRCVCISVVCVYVYVCVCVCVCVCDVGAAIDAWAHA